MIYFFNWNFFFENERRLQRSVQKRKNLGCPKHFLSKKRFFIFQIWWGLKMPKKFRPLIYIYSGFRPGLKKRHTRRTHHKWWRPVPLFVLAPTNPTYDRYWTSRPLFGLGGLLSGCFLTCRQSNYLRDWFPHRSEPVFSAPNPDHCPVFG